MKKRTKKTFSISGKVFVRLLVCTLLCGLLYISMEIIAWTMFKDEDPAGYQVYNVTEGVTENFYYADGVAPEDKPESTDTVKVTDLWSVSPSVLTTFHILAQIMMLIVLAIFPYHILWDLGNRDDTKVRYKGMKPDPMRGYRIGAIASIPYVLLWVSLWLAKFGVLPNGFGEVYRLCTIPFMPFNNWIMPSNLLNETAVWRILVLAISLLFVPVVCGVSYQMGHRQFSIREHLVFAKKSDKSEDEI